MLREASAKARSQFGPGDRVRFARWDLGLAHASDAGAYDVAVRHSAPVLTGNHDLRRPDGPTRRPAGRVVCRGTHPNAGMTPATHL